MSEISAPLLCPARDRSSLTGYIYSSDPNPHQLAAPHPTDVDHLCTHVSPYPTPTTPGPHIITKPDAFQGAERGSPRSPNLGVPSGGTQAPRASWPCGACPQHRHSAGTEGWMNEGPQRPAFKSPRPPSQLLSVPSPRKAQRSHRPGLSEAHLVTSPPLSSTQ